MPFAVEFMLSMTFAGTAGGVEVFILASTNPSGNVFCADHGLETTPFVSSLKLALFTDGVVVQPSSGLELGVTWTTVALPLQSNAGAKCVWLGLADKQGN